MPEIVTDEFYKDAEIEERTRLYRIVKSAYSDQASLLNGCGCDFTEGRFHVIHKRTSYSSNNVILCMAEVLFHMYQTSMRKLKNNNLSEFRTESSKKFHLVVFRTYEIDNLIYLDSDEGKMNYNVNPSSITHTDSIYERLQRAANFVRQDHKNGIVVSSARHSKGYVAVLFKDHTNSIYDIEMRFDLKLSLLKEDLSISTKDRTFNPIRDRVSQSIGQFEFDSTQYRQNINMLSPILPHHTGRINFYRKYYQTQYPDSAIL